MAKIITDKKYVVDVALGKNKGDYAETSVVLRERPFVLSFLTHQIVDDGTSPSPMVQHGGYSIDWSIQNEKRYWQGDSAPMADAAFGSVRTGRWIPLNKPIGLEAKTTLYIRVTNRREVINPYEVQIILHGIEEINE